MAIQDPFFDLFRKEKYKDFQVNTDELQAPGRTGRRARREANRIYSTLGEGAQAQLGTTAMQQGLDILEGKSPFEQDSAETSRKAAEAAAAQSGQAAAATQDLAREARAGGGMSQGAVEDAIGAQVGQQEDVFLRAYGTESAQARQMQFENEQAALERMYTSSLQAMEEDDRRTAEFVSMLIGATEGGLSGAGLVG